MTEPEIQKRVIAIVAEQMGVDKSKIKRESSFTNDLNADSLDIVELVMEVEDQFGISIQDDQCHRIQTVGSAIYYIKANLGAGPKGDAAKSAKQYIDKRTGKILSSNEIKELLKSGSMESFIISGVIGYATDSALLGGIVGGDLLGGVIGDVLNSSDDDSSSFIDDLFD